MKNIGFLKNRIQNYPWGSRTFIPKLMGASVPAKEPCAELWLGSHPKAPSLVDVNGTWVPITDIINEDPIAVLGKSTASKFENQLPFLLKILAAQEPLSIQAHPNREQAAAGFRLENTMGVSSNSPHRNYRDANHKPELLCALTPFWALKGFREARERKELLDSFAFFDIAEVVFKEPLLNKHLRSFFTALLSADRKRQAILVKEVVKAVEKTGGGRPALSWVIALSRSFPGDIGVLAPLVLNLIQLEPGEAIFVPPGELHAYLKGAAIEVMANSDNVLRGGLTSKHVDVQQLLKIVQFNECPLTPMNLIQGEGGEGVYPASADEFVLSKIDIEEGVSFSSLGKRSVEILIMVEGEAMITDLGSLDTLRLRQGASVLVPAAVSKYLITGNGKIYKASVPQE